MILELISNSKEFERPRVKLRDSALGMRLLRIRLGFRTISPLLLSICWGSSDLIVFNDRAVPTLKLTYVDVLHSC